MTNSNNKFMNTILSGTIIILIALFSYLNSSKVSKDVFELNREWTSSQFSEIKSSLQQLNIKIDKLLEKD